MARTLRDSNLGTRAARLKLKPRGKPYWKGVEQGLHLGYRRLKGKPGTWNVRHYIGSQTYLVELLGRADDASDADGIAVLSFDQAQRRAREHMVKRAHKEAGQTGPVTVAD
ncbi:MAG TPA: site-specific integrase, partial [Xanthobacteraceae bacterium]